MRRKVVKILAAALAGAMTLSLAACGSSEGNGNDSATADKDYKIGLVVKTASNAHFQDIAYGAQQAAQDYGVKLSILNTTTESDVEGQVKMCEDLISQGCDALILTANDSSGVSTAVEEAYNQKVKFVAVDTEIDDAWGADKYLDYVPTYIGVNHTDAGYQLAKSVCEKIGGKGNVVVLRGVDAASSSNQRTEGIKKALAEYPNIKIVAEQSGEYDTEKAQAKMGDILQSNKNINAVICCNDLMAMGAINALEEQGLTVNPDNGVVVAGLDGNIVGLQSISDGKMYSTLYDWSYLQGYWAVYNAIQMLLGNNVAENIVAPATVITKDNVEKYLPHAEKLADWTMGDKID